MPFAALPALEERDVVLPREPDHDPQCVVGGTIEQPAGRGRVDADGVDPVPRHRSEVVVDVPFGREEAPVVVRCERAVRDATHVELLAASCEKLPRRHDTGARVSATRVTQSGQPAPFSRPMWKSTANEAAGVRDLRLSPTQSSAAAAARGGRILPAWLFWSDRSTSSGLAGAANPSFGVPAAHPPAPHLERGLLDVGEQGRGSCRDASPRSSSALPRCISGGPRRFRRVA